MTRILLGLCLSGLLANASWSVEPPRVVAVEITDLQGQPVKLPLPDKQATVLIFLATSCPIANAYAPEISRIYAEFAPQNIGFFLVYSARDLSDSACQAHVRDYRLPATVIRDPKQRLATATGVKVTPEVAVMNPDGRLCYRGRIDNLFAEIGVRRHAPTTRELRETLEAIVAKRIPPMRQSKAIGCLIE
jgi:hypothetical protein